MKPVAITSEGFDSVAKCMPQVQRCPEPVFLLILSDNICLAGARTEYGFSQGFAIKTHKFIHCLFQPIKKSCITNQAVLDDLCEPRRYLSRWQTVKRIRIN